MLRRLFLVRVATLWLAQQRGVQATHIPSSTIDRATSSSSPLLLLKSRVVAALRGAFVADVASMGTHWIYDPAEMARTVDSLDAPEFKTPPKPSFYSAEEFPGHYGPGMPSPYGEQLLFVAEHVANQKQVSGVEMSKAMVTWANSFGGRPDHALKAFLENMSKEDGSGQFPNCGADDDQAHIYMKIVPVTCLYAGRPELQEKVLEAIQVHQNNKIALAFGLAAARILEAVLLGAPLGEALDTCLENYSYEHPAEQAMVLEAFQRGKATIHEYDTLESLLLQLSHEKVKDPESKFYNFSARSCQLPGSFTGPIYQLYKAAAAAATSNSDHAYVQAIRENILAAGDTCSRAQFVGAVLAAWSPQGNPPQMWVDKVNPDIYARLDAAAQTIAELSATSKD